MGSYDTPNPAEMYFNRSIFGHLFTAIAGIPPLPRHRKSPARAVAPARRSASVRTRKPTLLDRLAGSHEPDGIHLIKPEMRIRQSTSPVNSRS